MDEQRVVFADGQEFLARSGVEAEKAALLAEIREELGVGRASEAERALLVGPSQLPPRDALLDPLLTLAVVTLWLVVGGLLWLKTLGSL